jgi:2'-5' RNA ligase
MLGSDRVDQTTRRRKAGVYLSAVIVPPLAQREEVARLLADIGARMDVPAPTARRRVFGRSRPADAPVPSAGLTPLPVGRMTLHVTRFGYVEPEAAARLQATLEHDALDWDPLTVHVTGEAQMGGQDELLHLSLGGDVGGLRGLFREVTESARKAGFMLDRRSFVPMVPVATLDEAVSDEALAILVEGLDGFSGMSWQVEELTLARLGFGPADAEVQVVAGIPVGTTAG